MKKTSFAYLVVGIALCVSCFLMNTTSYAQTPISVYVNGEKVVFQVSPIVDNGSVMVQFRPIFEKLGYSVDYTPASGRIKNSVISGEKNGHIVMFIVGSKNAVSGGKGVTLTVAPKSVNGSTLIPLRFIGEASGYAVNYDAAHKRVDINSSSKSAENAVAGNTQSKFIPKYKWNTSIETVKSNETSKIALDRTNAQGNRELVYVSDFGGNDGRVGYIFNSTGLIEILYLSKSTSAFDKPYGTYTGLYMDLSYEYNDGVGPDDYQWETDASSVSAYKSVFGNDHKGMVQAAMETGELTLLAQYLDNDSTIYLSMLNGGSYSSPSYSVALDYKMK